MTVQRERFSSRADPELLAALRELDPAMPVACQMAFENDDRTHLGWLPGAIARGLMAAFHGKQAVKGEVRVAVVAKDGPAALKHLKQRAAPFSAQRLAGQVTGKIDNGCHPAERGRPTGRLGRLGHHVRLAGPVRRDGNTNMGMGLNPAWQNDFSRCIDYPSGRGTQSSRLAHGNDMLPGNAYIQFRRGMGRHNGSPANDEIQHSPPPGCYPSSLYSFLLLSENPLRLLAFPCLD